ncbi:MATE family efflux transporter [Butyrivibrio sp. NC3005]|uniref:MATE family efflux transporter n=1 Tax=Butyrivibrio sp. NC3005 TaxID=1280685 RepID=UPI0004231B52|nr:MATE family efflux transporter [Butyrivibrio sp. NC3005]
MEKTENKHLQNSIIEGNIKVEMLRYFFPLLFGSFFQQLYNTVDAIIVGKYVSPEALAAVGGSAAMIVNLFVGFFGGLASGATVVIAQFYGAKQMKMVKKAIHTSIALAFTGGLAFTIIGFIFTPWGIEVLKTPKDTIDMSTMYLRIYFLGMIPNIVYNVGSGVLRALGDSKSPLWVLLVATFSNIILDILFVIKMDMGVVGVAIATILCQLISSILILVIMVRIKAEYKLRLKEIAFDKGIMNRIIQIGLPAGIQSSMYTLSNLLIQSAINSFGTAAVSAWAAYGKIDVILWMIMQSLGIAVTTFVGQNYGAGKNSRVRESIKQGLIFTYAMTISLSIIMYVARMPLLGLFISNHKIGAEVLRYGNVMMRCMVPFYGIYVAVEILAGALRGIGDTLIPTIMTLSGICLLRIVWILFIVPISGKIEMVVYSYPVTWAVTSTMFIIYFVYVMVKKKSF